MEEYLKIVGTVDVVLRGKDGKIKATRHVSNLIVNGGFDLICDRLGHASPAANARYIAIGTSATAADPAQTALGAEVARALATYAHTGGTKVFTLVYNFPAGTGTGTIQETGLFNAATGVTMQSRQTFGAVTKTADDELTITWTYTLS